jgi:nicotinamidase-related amidase
MLWYVILLSRLLLAQVDESPDTCASRPDHCVVDTEGWELESSLRALLDEKERDGLRVEWVRKGTDKAIDAYSAFSDASRSPLPFVAPRPPLTPAPPLALPHVQNQYSLFTPLARILFSRGVTHLTVVGLALDYCVRASVLDARKFGLEVTVVRAGVRGVKAEDDGRVFDEFRRKGVTVV